MARALPAGNPTRRSSSSLPLFKHQSSKLGKRSLTFGKAASKHRSRNGDMDASFPPPQHTNPHHRQIQYHETSFQRNGLGAADPDAVFHPHLQPFQPHPYGPASQVPPAAAGPNGAVGNFEVADVEPALAHPPQSLPQLRSHQGELLQSSRKHLPQQRQQAPGQSHQQRQPLQQQQPQLQEAGSALDTAGHRRSSIPISRTSEEDVGGRSRPAIQVEDVRPLGHGPEQHDTQVNGQASAKFVVDPPNLAEWRQKLFDLEEMVILDQEE